MKRLKSLTKRSGMFGLILTILATVFGISSCRPDFDLDKRMPEWLGTSIYETLKEGFKNDSTKEVYTFNTFVKLIEDLDQVKVLGKTGSKTLFVADDEAFKRFFQNCPFTDANGNKVTEYSQLTKAQKTMILNGSMLNNVYQVAMLSSSPGGNNNPPKIGNCMRRVSAATILDTIPVVRASELPSNNKYWERLRTKNEGKSIVLLQDGTNKPIIFFVRKFLQANKITVQDYDFLFRLGDYSPADQKKDSYKTTDASVNGVAIAWPNKKCFNGFIHVMSDVIYLLPNMAECIASNPDTRIWSSILDRFSVPYYDKSSTAKDERDRSVRYLIKEAKRYPIGGALDLAMEANGDSVYVKKYLSDRGRVQTQTQGAKIDTNFDDLDAASASELLKFDPGWNSYISSTVAQNSDVALQQDMGLMLVPLDEYLMTWWLDPNQIGARLRERYGLEKYKGRNDLTVDEVIEDMSEIEMKTIVKLVNVNMQNSLVGSVPSKFSSVLDDAQDPFFADYKTQSDAEKTIVDVAMCCNGAIYFTNKVFVPTAYRSVAYPVLVNEKLKVIDWAINEDEELAFSAYLNSMVAEYSFFVPLIDTVNGSEFENKLVWIDPASFYLKKLGAEGGTSLKALAFSYGKNNKGVSTVIADVYDYDETTGVLAPTGQRIVPDRRLKANSTTDYEDTEEAKFVRNRILDLMDYHIIIGDVEDPKAKDPEGYSYFRTKGRGTIKFKSVSDPAHDFGNMFVEGGWQIENEGKPDLVQRPVKVVQRNDLSKKNEEAITKGNGRTYVLDRPLLPSRRSVYDIVSDSVHYPEFHSFFKLMERTDIFAESSNTNAIASQYCISTFNTYHYTVYIPKNAGVDKLLQDKVLMLPEALKPYETRYDKIKQYLQNRTGYATEALKTEAFNRDFRDSLVNITYELFGVRDTAKAIAAITGGTKYLTDIKREQLRNFVKYHIQDNSVYVGAEFDAGIDEHGDSATVATYETAYMNANQQFVKLNVKGGDKITLTDRNKNTREVQLINNAEGKPYYNIMCREYEIKPLTGSLSETSYNYFSIETSSYAVVHLIDEPLCNGDVIF